MNYSYNGTGGLRKVLYEDIDALRTEHGLLVLMRKAEKGDPEYKTFDSYKVYAVIRLGDGERIVRD